VQVGEDDALVDDHHAGADATLHLAGRLVRLRLGRLALGQVAALLLGLGLGRLLLGAVAHHAHHGGADDLGGLGGRRGQGGGLEGAQDGGVDVLLRVLPDVLARPQRDAGGGRPEADGEQQREAAAPGLPARLGGRRRDRTRCVAGRPVGLLRRPGIGRVIERRAGRATVESWPAHRDTSG
jgi:hypothetical protein